jgi:hypothetical protein
MLRAGIWLLHAGAVTSLAEAARVADLLTDPRWPWQPSLVRPTQRPGHPVYPWPKGKIPRADIRARVIDVLSSDDTLGIHLSASRQDAGNNAWAYVRSGRAAPHQDAIAYPFESMALCRGDAPGKSLDDWLAVARELALVLHAVHGVVWVGTDEAVILTRQFLNGSVQPRQPADHPHNESARVNRARRELGERYVRLPGWATFLRAAHVEAVGGRARLLAAVEPPVVHDVGDLLYVQLSATVADALAPATEARRRALAELLAPITVPAVPDVAGAGE